MEYTGCLVNAAAFDDPPEYGIVIKQDDNFVPPLLDIYIFEEQRVIQSTAEMVEVYLGG
jgi:hypothetical protein